MYDDLRLPYQVNVNPTLSLGGIFVNNEVVPDAPVNLVLKSFNRHGLIAGATGSGKTKTMQVLAEQLSLNGVPSLVMDIKGDISGLAMPGESSEFLVNRGKSLNLPFTPSAYPVEFLSLQKGQAGVPLRSTVMDFGAVLFARLLDLNETQSGVITIVFEFAKDNNIKLIDLLDVKNILQYLQTDEGNAQIEKAYGAVASTSVGTIFRAIIELESQGAEALFGEPAFDVQDLVRITPDNYGVISIVRLMTLQDRPKLFSTFMLKLLTDVYRKMPELGDPEKPKLVIFIDEAHLIFNHATKAVLDLLETMVKLIRSKGIGLIFCTQMPDDVPDSVLSQLGLKVQHTLRAFTAKDRKAMKLVAQNFPPSTYYNTEELLTSLSTGEALLTSLDGKGQPTPLVQCIIRAPASRMGTLSDSEMASFSSRSTLMGKYGTKIEHALQTLGSVQATAPASPNGTSAPSSEPSVITTLSKNTLVRQVIRQVFRDGFKALFSILKGKR